MLPLDNGEVLLAGYTSSINFPSNTANDENALIMKIGKFGNTKWVKVLKGEYTSIGTSLFEDIIKTSDGNNIVVGTIYADERDGNGIIAKYNSKGDTLWTKLFGSIENEELKGIVELKNGDLLVFGSSTKYFSGGPNTDDADPWITKLNANGRIKWSKYYTEPNGASFTPQDILKVNNDTLFLMSKSSLLKIDSKGNIIYHKVFKNRQSFQSLAETPNGDLIIVAGGISAFSKIQVIKINKKGGIKWNRVIDDNVFLSYEEGYGLEVLANGNILIGGSFKDGKEAYLTLLNSQGNTMWEAGVGSSFSSFSNEFYNVNYTKPGKIIATGAIEKTSNSGSYTDIGLIKTDTLNRQGCKTQPDLSNTNAPSINIQGLSNNIKVDTPELFNRIKTKTINLCGKPFCQLNADFKVEQWCANVPVNFYDRTFCDSLKSYSWHWEFNDPNAKDDTSNRQNPTYQFSRADTYNVQLIVSSKIGSDTVTKPVIVKEPTDTVKSAKPSIDRITHQSDSVIFIDWSLSSPIVDRYVLLRSTDTNNFKAIDTIRSATDTTYMDKLQNLPEQPYCYRLKAFDTCIANASTPSKTHCTIFLTADSTNCEQDIELAWTPYQGFDSISQYAVYRRTKGSNWQLIATVQADTTGYRDVNVIPQQQYTYRVVAVNGDSSLTSSSNHATIQPFQPNTPEIRSISKRSTSADQGKVKISWKNQQGQLKLHYQRLYYKAPDSNGFKLLQDSIPLSKNNFIHTGLNTKYADHRYYLTTVDSCGNESDSASIHETMELEFEVGQLLHALSWTPYEGWPVQNYLVQRRKGSRFITLDSLPAGDTAITKYPEPCNVPISYRIKAIDSNGNFSYSDTGIREAIDTIPPNGAKFRNATVINDSVVKVIFQGADSLDIFAYDVMQKQGSGNFKLAERIIFDSAGGRFTVYDTLNTAKDPLCYQILTQDSCLNTVPSDTFCPAYLTGKPGQLQNQLSWKPFSGYSVDSQFLLEKQGNRYDTLARLGAADSAFLHDSLVCNNAHTYRLLSFEKGGSRKTFSNTLTLIPFDTVAPPSPTLRYVSVKAKDKVKVAWNWDQQSDQKYFEVWRDRGRGNFQLLDTVVYDTTYTDTTANPSAIAHHYYIVAADSCSADNRSIPSDTGRILQPSVTTGGCRLENRLSWNAYEDLPEGTDYYEIYKAKANGTFRRLKEVTQLSYADTAVSANQTYCYRLRAVDSQSGYWARSAAVCQKPKSYGAPDTLNTLDQVTVTGTGSDDGKVKITWKRPVEADDADYTLYRKQGSEAYQLLDTMSGNSYLDKNLNTKEKPYTYRLKTVDSCDNLSDSFSTPHKTINLEANGSEEAVILSWNEYKGRAVSQYQVIRGNEVLYTVSGEQTFLRDEKVVCDTFYNYQVRAPMEGDTSIIALSNTDSAKATDNTPPRPVYLQRAAVTSFNDVVELKWQASEAYDAKVYQIYRRNENTGDFNQIAQVAHPNTTYQDSFPINNRELCYFVKVKDACGNRSAFSNRGCIIQPEGEALDLGNELSWPPYEKWQKGTRTYEVFKQTGDSTYQSLARLDSSQRSYLDQDLRDSADQFCYYIRAEGFGEGTFSRSTRICLEQSAVVYIPNTFTPANTEGMNDEFGPQGLYIDNYEMQIYNRWGEQVFSTSTSEEWDGTYNGELVPQGVYHYQIVVRSEDGSRETYEGRVTVIR